MYNAQKAPLALYWRALPDVQKVSLRIWKSIAGRYSKYRYDKAVSKLPPYLQYDAGIIDARPERPRLPEEILKSRRNTLEDMWLRYL